MTDDTPEVAFDALLDALLDTRPLPEPEPLLAPSDGEVEEAPSREERPRGDRPRGNRPRGRRRS